MVDLLADKQFGKLITSWEKLLAAKQNMYQDNSHFVDPNFLSMQPPNHVL